MNHKILIVDDDRDDIELLLEIFHSTDYVHAVKTFEAADFVLSHLDNIEESLFPSLIISDVNMPRYSGIWLLEKIKLNKRYQSIAFVLCSTTVMEAEKKRSLELGANDFVTKPLTMWQLEELKRRVLEILSQNGT